MANPNEDSLNAPNLLKWSPLLGKFYIWSF